ncbi:hypothetical protein A9Q81_05755 [Gammaproteobacteria bacterium 42_54_T18]|nr:hypothetical protein A9Q81_05755 [Gammaproteobacteria bacterium 42_54_T18]
MEHALKFSKEKVAMDKVVSLLLFVIRYLSNMSKWCCGAGTLAIEIINGVMVVRHPVVSARQRDMMKGLFTTIEFYILTFWVLKGLGECKCKMTE